MKKIVALFTAAAMLGSVVALAGPPPAKSTKKDTKSGKTTKITDVWTCPITGEAVKDKSSKGTVVGSYRVHFCCAGCPEQFAKLSDKDKKTKAADAAKKDAAAAKKS
jgi:hypothetical protein